MNRPTCEKVLDFKKKLFWYVVLTPFFKKKNSVYLASEASLAYKNHCKI